LGGKASPFTPELYERATQMDRSWVEILAVCLAEAGHIHGSQLTVEQLRQTPWLVSFERPWLASNSMSPPRAGFNPKA